MKKFIGTKLLMAVAMTLGAYNEKRGWKMPENEDPTREGYFVEYEDGYQSWSPKEVFEEAYRETTGMNFGLALESLKKGKLVTRSGWNGKGMWLFRQIGNTVSKDFIPKFASLPDAAKAKLSERDTDVVFNSSITMLTATGELQPGWLASQTDMLADDWMIVE